MDNFPKAFKTLLGIEGGFVNHPKDRGGATNWGITIQTLSSYMGEGKIATIDDVRNLNQEDAERIYRILYWEPAGCDQIQDWRLAYILFDQCVNRGVRTGVRMLQQALNKNIKVTDLLEDGIMGPTTVSIINDQTPEFLGMWFCEVCTEGYARIVEYNQSQVVFLRGWLSRVNKMQRMFWDKTEG